MSQTTSSPTPWRVRAAVVLSAVLLAVAGAVGGLAGGTSPAGAAYGSATATFGTLSCTGWVAATNAANAVRADFTIAGGGGRGGGQAPDDDNTGNPGGSGGSVSGRIAMDPGDGLFVWQGCGGSSTTGARGYADGGDGSGAGGGATALCVGPTSTTCTVVAIAGGGGGGGRASDNGAVACSSGNDGGDGGAANGGSESSGQNGGTGKGGGRGASGSGGEPGRGGGGGGGIGVAGENGTSNGSAAGNNAGGLGGRVTSNNNGSTGSNGGGASSAPSAAGGTGDGGDRSSANSIDGGGGGGGYTGGGGGAGGVRRGTAWTGCYSTFSGAGGGGGGSSWATSAVTNRSFGTGAAGGGQGNGAGGNGTVSVTFVTNPAPVGGNVNAGTVNKGAATSITLPASDGETGFTCSVVSGPGKGGVTLGGPSSCTASYTPNAGTQGADSFTYRVTDADGRSSATHTVSLTIANRAPTGADQAVQASKGVGLPITLAASDLDGETASCTTAQPVQGSLSGSGCAVTYTAPADTFGTDAFTYTVTDPVGASSTHTVDVEILNQAPSAVAQAITVEAGSQAEVVLGGSDPDGDPTTCEVGVPSGGSLADGEDCTVTFTAPASPGVVTFAYYRVDGGGAASDEATVTVTVVFAAGIGGAVTSDATGEGLGGITVRLYQDGVGFTSYGTTTAADGTYDLGDDIADGTYRVLFKDPSQDHVDEWHEDSLLRSTSTPITVVDGGSATIDASLATASELQVQITTAGAFTVALYSTAPAGASATRSVAGVSGATTFRGLPAGTYYVSVTDPTGSYVQEWSGNQTDRAAAQGRSLGTGEVDEVLFTLAGRNTITGTITDVIGPLAGVSVQAYTATTAAYVKATKTDEDGEYLLRDLAPGTYKLVFRDTTGAHPATWYGGAEVIGSADVVTMPSGGTVTVDEQLPRVASISGTVTGGVEGTTALAGARVTLYRNGAPVRTVTTGADGSYVATGLDAGGYTLLFTAAGHRTEYNLDRSRRADADVVPVAGGATVTLDATLAPA
jgi:hypothetical protein